MRADNIPEEQQNKIKELARMLDALIADVLEADPNPLIEPNYMQRLNAIFENECEWIRIV